MPCNFRSAWEPEIVGYCGDEVRNPQGPRLPPVWQSWNQRPRLPSSQAMFCSVAPSLIRNTGKAHGRVVSRSHPKREKEEEAGRRYTSSRNATSRKREEIFLTFVMVGYNHNPTSHCFCHRGETSETKFFFCLLDLNFQF